MCRFIFFIAFWAIVALLKPVIGTSGLVAVVGVIFFGFAVLCVTVRASTGKWPVFN